MQRYSDLHQIPNNSSHSFSVSCDSLNDLRQTVSKAAVLVAYSRKKENKSLHLQQQTGDAHGFEEQGDAEVDDDASPEMAGAPGKDAKDIASDDG